MSRNFTPLSPASSRYKMRKNVFGFLHRCGLHRRVTKKATNEAETSGQERQHGRFDRSWAQSSVAPNSWPSLARAPGACVRSPEAWGQRTAGWAPRISVTTRTVSRSRTPTTARMPSPSGPPPPRRPTRGFPMGRSRFNFFVSPQ